MIYIVVLLIVFFLVWAAGRETRWGGLGLLWRVVAWGSGIFVVGTAILFGYFAYSDHIASLERQRQMMEVRQPARENFSVPKIQPVAQDDRVIHKDSQQQLIGNTVDFSINLKDSLIRSYYSAIDRKDFQMAYGMFTREYASTINFKTWSEGYSETLEHQVNSIECEDDVCRVVVNALDLKTKENGYSSYSFLFLIVADGIGKYYIADINYIKP